MRTFSTFIVLALVGICLTSTSVHAQDSRDAFAKSYQYERSQAYGDAIKVLLPLKETYLVDLRLGWLYYLSGNFANARQYYQVAIQAAPKAVEPRLGLSLVLIAQARWAEVETLTRTILTINPSNYLGSLRLAFALRMQSKFPQAREVNTAMLELYPTDVSFLAEQMLVSVATKNPDARSLCETILTLDPENLTAKQQMAAFAPPKSNGAPVAPRLQK